MNLFSGRWVRGGGFVVAVLGFGITRLFVAGSLGANTSLPSLLTELLPLVVGLGLTVYGVVLAVGPFSGAYVNDVAKWCLLGTVGMLVVFLVTSSGAILRGEGFDPLFDSPVLVANVLLGGAIGGVVVGHRSALNRQQRRVLRRRTNQALLVNRLLRHEVINAATIADGYADRLADAAVDEQPSVEAISESMDRIVDAVEDVGDVTADPGDGTEVDVADALSGAVAAARSASPATTMEYRGTERGVPVVGGHHLDVAFRKLFAHVVDAAGATDVTVDLVATEADVVVTVDHDGEPFSEGERDVLLDGDFPEFDDPTSGFDLQIVRLLVDKSGGSVRIPDGGTAGSTTFEVVLPRENTLPTAAAITDVTGSPLARGIVAGTVAGVIMGWYFALTSDTMAIIGALYGVESHLVGWTMHLFHSVVFAVLFAAGCTHLRNRSGRAGGFGTVGMGLVWGTVLWLVAAGVVMPLWLRFLGVPAALPNLSRLGLVSHLIWGGVLGGSYVVIGVLGDKDSITRGDS